MKPERRIEKFLRRIDVIPDAERKHSRLEELLEVRDKTKKPMSVDAQPTIRRYIINRQIWKIAAALVVTATVIGVIGILQNGGQTTYAFEQTVAAMQGKRFFHIQTYYDSPTLLKDEYWAEFDEHGQVIRLRQKEWLGRKYPEVEVIWENQIKYQYELDDKRGEPGILLISNKKHHVDEEDLEEFDPETMIEEINRKVEDGLATVKVDDSQIRDGNLIVEVMTTDDPYRRVMLVDPETKFVLRWELYDEQDDEGNWIYNRGIEVLEYNKPLDPNIFHANFPDDTIIIDQTAGAVGIAQGDSSDKEVAYEAIRQGLEAWAADDYETAGKLFGGAPKEFFAARAYDKPLDEIIIGEPEWCPLEPNRPRYRIICSYVTEREGERKKTRISYCVTTVAGQPGRWFITPIKL
jgi:hypothetical protein